MALSPPTSRADSRRFKLSRYVVVGQSMPVAGSEPHRVVYSTRSSVSLVVPESYWNAAADADWSALQPEFLAALERGYFIVPEEEDELQAVLSENEIASSEVTELVQVLQPSAACQLACVYCGQEHSPASMSERRQDGVLRRIEGRLRAAYGAGKPYERLTIGWFGAEPLLGLKALRRLSPPLASLAQQFDCGYSSRLVTNGLRLERELARELQDEHGVRYIEITLDGKADEHDRRRYTKAGRGSFQRIFSNLEAVASDEHLRCELVVRSNVDQDNAESVPDLITLLAHRGLHRRVKLYFSPVYAWGNDAHAGALPPEQYAAMETSWLAQMVSLGYSVDMLPARRPIVCLALRRGGRVTDAFGTEFNCTEAPYVPSYGSPNVYAVGNVDDTEDPKRPLHFQSWHQDIADARLSPCSSCRILPLCGGACPKAWHDGNPPCPSTKFNLEERLVLSLAARRARS